MKPKKSLIQWLGLLGLVSLLSYTAAVAFSPGRGTARVHAGRHPIYGLGENFD